MRLGLLTIGQAPRGDIVPEIAPLLAGITLVERGALDDCTPQQIAQFEADPRGSILATRLRSGQGVVVGEDQVLPRLMQQMTQLEADGVQAIALLCTGHFPQPQLGIPVLRAEPLLQQFVLGLQMAPVGIITPESGQVDTQVARWQEVLGQTVQVVAANPYRLGAIQAVEQAARELASRQVQLLVLDCLGYTGEMRQVARQVSGKPVILARTVLARAAAELLGEM